MALPVNVKAKLEASFHAAHTTYMIEAKSNVRSANNVIRHSAARMFDEPSPAQARAIDKILNLPIKT